MNKLIKNELNKIKSVVVPTFDDTTTELVLTKENIKVPITPTIGHCYLIDVQEYIINPFPGFTLHINWNNNTHPVERQMTAELIKVVGKMYYLHTVGVNTNSIWDGWIPDKSIEFIKEL